MEWGRRGQRVLGWCAAFSFSPALLLLSEEPNKIQLMLWDACCIDYCLAHFLRGIVLRLIAHPANFTKVKPLKSPIPTKEADEQAMISFK